MVFWLFLLCALLIVYTGLGVCLVWFGSYCLDCLLCLVCLWWVSGVARFGVVYVKIVLLFRLGSLLGVWIVVC